MVRPLRALAAARAQVLWNTVRKGQGAFGAAAAALLLVVGVACLVPPFYMFLAFGRELGGDLAAPESPAMGWLVSLHAIVVFGLGAAAGVRQHGAFDRDLLRMLPLRKIQAALAELPFLLLDTLPILGLVFLAGLGTGMAGELPEHRLAIAWVTLNGVVSLLLVQQLVGVLRRLAGGKSFRALVGIALALLLVVIASQFLLQDDPARFVQRLPSGAGWEALRLSVLGESGAAAMRHALLVAWNLGLFAVTAWLHARELGQDPPLRIAEGTDEKLWTFRTPGAGIARLFLAQVTGSRRGQLLLVLPAFVTGAFVLASVIVTNSAAGREGDSGIATMQALLGRVEALPLWFAIPVAVACFNGELWLNQFSWDGKGIKTLVLAPLRTEDLLWGKLLGLLCLQVPQGLLACLPLLRLAAPSKMELLAGLAGGAAATVFLGSVGHLLSAHYPRAQRAEGEGASGAPPQLGLIATVAILIVAGLSFVLWTVSSGFAPWAPAAVFAVLAAALLGGHRLFAPELARRVDEQRETLVETLS